MQFHHRTILVLLFVILTPLAACGGSDDDNQDNATSNADVGIGADVGGDAGEDPPDADAGEDSDPDAGGEPDADAGEDSDPDAGGEPDADAGEEELPYTLHPIENPSFEEPVLEPGISGQLALSPERWDTLGSDSFWFQYRPLDGEFNVAEPLPAPADGEQVLVANVGYQETTRLTGIGDSVITDSIAGEVIELSVAVLRPLSGDFPHEIGVSIDAVVANRTSNLAIAWMETMPEPGEITELTVRFTVPDYLEGVPLFPALYVTNVEMDYRNAYFDKIEFRRYTELVDPAPTGLINGDFEEPVLHRERLFTQGALGWAVFAPQTDYFGIRRPSAGQLPFPMASGQNVLELGFVRFSSGNAATRFRTFGLIPFEEGKSYLVSATVAKRQDRPVPTDLVLRVAAVNTTPDQITWTADGLDFDLDGGNGSQWHDLTYCVAPPAGTQGQIAIDIAGMHRNMGANSDPQRIMISEISLEEVDDCP